LQEIGARWKALDAETRKTFTEMASAGKRAAAEKRQATAAEEPLRDEGSMGGEGTSVGDEQDVAKAAMLRCRIRERLPLADPWFVVQDDSKGSWGPRPAPSARSDEERRADAGGNGEGADHLSDERPAPAAAGRGGAGGSFPDSTRRADYSCAYGNTSRDRGRGCLRTADDDPSSDGALRLTRSASAEPVRCPSWWLRGGLAGLLTKAGGKPIIIGLGIEGSTVSVPIDADHLKAVLLVAVGRLQSQPIDLFP
jgi:hypothetical protein